ncbi:hypothetical protein NGRA_1244 [Nosema granulosis]|uniref:Uncharacterized protein n=1 Tax=Nosema granulosis TaxID=83296 RepID=A0A9P6KZA3_9MICR|nr:hypothetical protein NGRA_1244 [Nosema granulosis]
MKRSKRGVKKTLDDANSLKTKVELAFSSTNTIIYKRETEIDKITTFLKSKEKILNIVGVPGTGKTSTVLNLCKKIKKHIYLNFYKEPNLKKIVLKKKYDLVIIDEFDKFHQSKLADCRFVIHHITSQGSKLITLGNDLELESSAIFFKPYTSKEIEEVVQLKMEKEVGKQILSNLDLKILCRTYSTSGDMRNIFKFIVSNFNQDIEMVEVKRQSSCTVNDSTEEDVSIHHRIIQKLNNIGSRVRAFKMYLNECEDYGVPPLSRMMFYELYETICYK